MRLALLNSQEDVASVVLERCYLLLPKVVLDVSIVCLILIFISLACLRRLVFFLSLHLNSYVLCDEESAIVLGVLGLLGLLARLATFDLGG